MKRILHATEVAGLRIESSAVGTAIAISQADGKTLRKVSSRLAREIAIQVLLAYGGDTASPEGALAVFVLGRIPPAAAPAAALPAPPAPAASGEAAPVISEGAQS